jgi:hypothetical protein
LTRKLQDAECEEASEETKPSRRYGTKRRTRAAEVHNLSERVRSESDCASNQSLFSRRQLVGKLFLQRYLLVTAADVEKKGPDQ